MRWLLDTVTLSELRKRNNAHPNVRSWQVDVEHAWLSVITLQEILYGRRKVEDRDPIFASRLATWYAHILNQPDMFRIVAVDRAIAEQAAEFRAAYATPLPDALIAATAKVHDLTLATRNTADFAACGIALVNPWDPPA